MVQEEGDPEDLKLEALQRLGVRVFRCGRCGKLTDLDRLLEARGGDSAKLPVAQVNYRGELVADDNAGAACCSDDCADAWCDHFNKVTRHTLADKDDYYAFFRPSQEWIDGNPERVAELRAERLGR